MNTMNATPVTVAYSHAAIAALEAAGCAPRQFPAHSHPGDFSVSTNGGGWGDSLTLWSERAKTVWGGLPKTYPDKAPPGHGGGSGYVA